MPRRPVSRMTREEVGWEIRRRLDRHGLAREGEEAYQFDIKMYGIEVPDAVRAAFGEEDVSERIDMEMHLRLTEFMLALKEDFHWIGRAEQAGRSGGWLVVVANDAVLDDKGNVADRREARSRLLSVLEIEALVKAGKLALERDLFDPQWWGVGPKEWSPRGRGVQ